MFTTGRQIWITTPYLKPRCDLDSACITVSVRLTSQRTKGHLILSYLTYFFALESFMNILKGLGKLIFSLDLKVNYHFFFVVRKTVTIQS